MKATPVALGGLFVGTKFPLIKFKRNRYAGWWAVPGGKFDDGEFAAEAVEREMLEEVEHSVRFKELLAIIDEDAVYPSETHRLILYVCTVEPTGLVSMDPIDKEEGLIQWFDVTDLPGLEASIMPSDYRILHDIYFGEQRGYFKSILRKTDDSASLDLFEPVSSYSFAK